VVGYRSQLARSNWRWEVSEMPQSFHVKISRNGKIQGPFSGRQLKQLAESGQLQPEHLVSADEGSRWQPANRFSALKFGALVLEPSEPSEVPPQSPVRRQAPPPLPPDRDTAPLPVRTLENRDASGEREGPAKLGRDFLGKALHEGKRLWSDAAAEASRAIDESEVIALRDSIVFGRSSVNADWLLPHPDISTRHFEITKDDSAFYIKDLNSDTGTWVNGTRKPHGRGALQDGDTIAVGPYVFRFEGRHLTTVSKGQHAHLLCINLNKDVIDRGTGESLRILNDITIEFVPSEFVVILGPSGSGKSTLLNALSGRSLASSGHVIFNERDLYLHFDAVKKRMAIVPQKDLLHERLTLRDALTYTARLRLSTDVNGQEIRERVKKAAEGVELAERIDTVISNYSGGQVKRASLANEMLADPSLLFIDEATSGLDEHSDKEIMELLRRLADDGKTIICITHNLGNVEEFCHKVVVLANGGHLAFFGTPSDVLEYFDVPDLGSVYLRLSEKDGREWAEQFSVTDRFSAVLATTKKRTELDHLPEVSRSTASALQRVGQFIRHARTALERNIALQWADKRSLFVAGVQPLLVAFLICSVFGEVKGGGGIVEQFRVDGQSLTVLFLLTISAFWFGCSNSAKEIVKEQSLYERERDAGLTASSYFASKLILLSVFTIVQTAVLLVIVLFVTRIEGNLIGYATALMAVGVCGVALGLCISAWSTDTDVASTAVPIAVIPQVVLGGSVAKVEGFSELCAAMVSPCYWCYGMLSRVYDSADSTDDMTSPMLSQEKFLLSFIVILLYCAILWSITLFRLWGGTLKQLTEQADLEAWLNSLRRETSSAPTGTPIQPAAPLTAPPRPPPFKNRRSTVE